MKNKILCLILFFSFSVFATSVITLEKNKFVEDSDLGTVSVRVTSDYFNVLQLAHQTGILQDITFDKISLVNVSSTVNDLKYWSTGGTALEGILTVTYISLASWELSWWDTSALEMESAETNVLLESDYRIVLEKNSV